MLILYVFQTKAQLTEEELIVAYIYNFADHSEIEKCKKEKEYRIIIITENEDLIYEFKKNVASRKIHKKPVNLTVLPDINKDIPDACLIFVAEDKNIIYKYIFQKTKGKNILMVSHNYYDKRKVMLNLTDTRDGRITFEFNKANLYSEGIKVSDKLILSGGTEIDVIELYLNTKKKLAENEFKIQQLQSKSNKLNQNLKKLNVKISEQQKLINEQIRTTENQKKENKNLAEEKKRVLYALNKEKKLVAIEKQKLKNVSDSFIRIKENITEMKNILKEGAEELAELRNQISSKNDEIKMQEAFTDIQAGIISKQKKINYLYTVLMILTSVLLALLFMMFLYRNRKNKILKKQKKEIEEKEELLRNHLAEIRTFNKTLNEKNEELKSIIEKLKQTQKQLIQSEKMASLGVLTAGIAHEINNPINFVYAGINSLKKDFADISIILEKINNLNPDDANLTEKIEEINKLKKDVYFYEAAEAIPLTIKDITTGAERTAEIIDGLRKFSRMDDNKFVKTDIHEHIQTALLILKNKYKHDIEIIKNYDNSIPEIECNPGKISQIFTNIIYNAVDAIKEKNINDGKIEITTSAENGKVKIKIKDNGTGINKKNIEKIFDPFFTTKKIGEGTGLGLAITYGIIQEHKGSIKVNTELGKGSEFEIILPIKQSK